MPQQTARVLQTQQALVFEFDSLEQKDLFFRCRPEDSRFFDAAEGKSAAAPHSFSGILRSADLLSSEILLLDVQLLDGALFLDRGPDKVRSFLAREIYQQAFTVLCRRDSLEETLRVLVLGSDPTSSTLARFEFSALAVFGIDVPTDLPEILHRRGSARLRSCPPERVAVTVAAELQAACESEDPTHSVAVPTGAFARLARAWQAWFAESASGRIGVRRWTGSFDMAGALNRRSCSASPVLDDARRYLAGTHQRSEALAYMRSLPGTESEEVRDWWMSAYYDALGRQHGATWLRFHQESESAAGSPIDTDRSKIHAVQFRGSLVMTLHDMPPQAYALLRHQARNAIRDWHNAPTQKNSDNLAYAVVHADSTVSRNQMRRATLARVAMTLGPICLGSVIGQLSDSLSAGLGAAILSVAVGIPLAEVAALQSMRSRNMRAYIHFPEASR